jgi:uncharacterized protein YhfF
MKVTKAIAMKYYKKYNINPEKVSFEQWHMGMNVEMEHGSKFGKITNVTDDTCDLTAKIVIAHLIEFPDYYLRLAKMEEAADKYWKNKNKQIFNELKN